MLEVFFAIAVAIITHTLLEKQPGAKHEQPASPRPRLRLIWSRNDSSKEKVRGPDA